MEAILLKLLVADNAMIQQGTAELKEAFKKPECVSALCRLLETASNSQIRQYAAVLLRKRYNRAKDWKKLPEGLRIEFKRIILKAMVSEQEKFVKNSITQLLGTIVKHEVPTNGWPEVFQFVQTLIVSDNLADKELGTYTLSIMTEVAPDTFGTHVRAMTGLIAQTLNSLHDYGSMTAFYILKTMQHLVPMIERDGAVQNTYLQVMPHIIATIQSLCVNDPDKAIQCFELLDELCENSNHVVSPHITSLVSMCLSIATDERLDDALRVKAISFIGWLARTRKKALIKYKMVASIIDTLFTMMTIPPQAGECEMDFGNSENEDITPTTCAVQTLDMLAIHLPPDKVLMELLRHIEPAIIGDNPRTKKAAYVAIAVSAEGCSEFIRTTYLEGFVNCICDGIKSPEALVHNAALFALGQFAEHLQPEISKYASVVLPMLFQYLSEVCDYISRENKEPQSVSRIFYALEMFCENLNKGFLPFLPTFMTKMLDILNGNTPMRVKELCLSAIGSASCASKEQLMPYFNSIMAILNRYLTQDTSEGDATCLQVQAVDTLGIIARTVGMQNFAPLAVTSLNIGMRLLKSTEDPDLKKSIYGLFASLSTILKKDMATALPDIVEYMILSIRSNEGIMTYLKDDETVGFRIFEDISDDENDNEEDIENTDPEDEEEDEEVAGYSVENSYIEEKEEAILALKEIAQYTEEIFLPYLERSFNEAYKLINYPHVDIRKASIDAVLQFCMNFSKIEGAAGKEATQKALTMFVPKLSEMIRLDPEQSIAISGLDALTELLKDIKSDVLIGEGHTEAVRNCVTDVLTNKTECQDQDDDVDAEAEQDELLVECAGDVLYNFGKALAPEDFALYFQTVLPMLLERVRLDKTEAQRSFAIGTISECFSGLKHASKTFVPQLLPVFMYMIQDQSAEVRNNAIYGIGELAFHGKEAVYEHYPNILRNLSNAIATETHAGARDNVVGAIARLILTNHTALPLEQVLPVFFGQLPLKQDLEENKSVYKSILLLYQIGHIVLQPFIPALLSISVSILCEEKTGGEEARNLVLDFVGTVKKDFPIYWSAIYAELPHETIVKVQCMLP